jgi:hypothetical protein
MIWKELPPLRQLLTAYGHDIFLGGLLDEQVRKVHNVKRFRLDSMVISANEMFVSTVMYASDMKGMFQSSKAFQ